MPQVPPRLREVHRRDAKAHADALVQGCEHPHAQLPGKGRLPYEQTSEGAGFTLHLQVSIG